MDVPYISDEDIHSRASSFLHFYHPSFVLPVPIEDISELMLEIMTIPIKNLEKVCEVDGYLSSDFRSIMIDENCFTNQEERARFTIAHEVGHFILHKKLYEARGISSIKEFIDFQNSLNSKNWKKLEIQAYFFAEEILFPREQFRKFVTAFVNKSGGTENMMYHDLQSLVGNITEGFCVSGSAAYNKLKREFPLLIETTQSNVPF